MIAFWVWRQAQAKVQPKLPFANLDRYSIASSLQLEIFCIFIWRCTTLTWWGNRFGKAATSIFRVRPFGEKAELSLHFERLMVRTSYVVRVSCVSVAAWLGIFFKHVALKCKHGGDREVGCATGTCGELLMAHMWWREHVARNPLTFFWPNMDGGSKKNAIFSSLIHLFFSNLIIVNLKKKWMGDEWEMEV